MPNGAKVVGGPNSTNEGMKKISARGKSRVGWPHSPGLRNYIKEETLAIHRDRNTNGNEIGENITIIQRKSRYGLHIHRTFDFSRTAERMPRSNGWR